MPRERERRSRLSVRTRRELLHHGLAAATALAGAATVAAYAAGAVETGLDAVFGRSREEREAELAQRIDDYLAGTGIEASVAVERGDRRLDYRPDLTHITASVVKVEIFAMVQQHWGAVEAIPGTQLELLDRMITESDNDATTALFDFLGGADALAAAHERFGLRDSTVDADGRWGVCWSSAPDQLTVTDLSLFEGVLDAEQVALGRELTGGVVEEQAWGVSAAAGPGESVWLKNGWDTESALDGRWVVNSIGVLGGDGDDPVKLAILTSGAANDAEGIPVVEEIARIARDAVQAG